MKRYLFFGKEVLVRSLTERSPLMLLGDHIDSAHQALARGDRKLAHRSAVNGLLEIAELVDPVNRNRLGISALQKLIAEAAEIEEKTG